MPSLPFGRSSRFVSHFLRHGEIVRVSGTCSRFRPATRESPPEGGEVEACFVSGEEVYLEEEEMEQVYLNMEEDSDDFEDERDQGREE